MYVPRYRKESSFSILKEEFQSQNERPPGVIFKETMAKIEVEFSPMFSSRGL